MKCLITGGAGFIGSHLLQRLLADGHHVRVLDNFTTGHTDNLSPPIQMQCFLDRLEIIDGDIRDKETCMRASQDCTHVFHLAAQTSAPYSIENPELTFDTNVSGFKNILDACTANDVRQFVYASSSAVYGNGSDQPNREDQPCQPESPYAQSKLDNENYAIRISEAEKINCIGLRYFNVFGPRQRSGNSYSPVIPNWIDSIVSNEPVLIFGDGSNMRDFLQVDDVVKANILASNCKNRALVVNIASGKSVSLIELFKIMVAAYKDMGFEYSRPAEFASPRMGDIRKSSADIAKAKRLLAFESSKYLQESIREMFTLRLN